MSELSLNIAGQCLATSTSELASNILVDEGNGTLKELLIDSAYELERQAKEIAELIEANNNLRSHRDEALTDAKEFCLQVSKLTEKLEQITSDITALRAVAKEMAEALSRGSEALFDHCDSYGAEHNWEPEVCRIATVAGSLEKALDHWKELEK